MKTEYAFKALNFKVKQAVTTPVAASVRKSQPTYVLIRIDAATAKKTQFRAGSILSPFVDEANRAILLLSDQRPTPPGARKCTGKDNQVCVELPRQLILEKWFAVGPMRPLELVEASHGRLVVVVPKS
jgi:hypothetical protein